MGILIRDWAFGPLGLRRLEFFIEPVNVASCRIAEALGAAQTELLQDHEVIQGTSRDMARYALNR